MSAIFNKYGTHIVIKCKVYFWIVSLFLQLQTFAKVHGFERTETKISIGIVVYFAFRVINAPRI
jgi:hypothetical protein